MVYATFIVALVFLPVLTMGGVAGRLFSPLAVSFLLAKLAPMGGEEAEMFIGEIRKPLLQFPGLTFKVKPFLVERMEETLSGATAAIVVNLRGEDLDALDRAAEDVRRVMAAVPGAADVAVENPGGAPELVARLRHERLSALGFSPMEILEAVETAFQGAEVGQVFDGNRVTDVTMHLPAAARRDPESLGALELTSPAGLRVPLREVAEIFLTDARSVIVHEGAQRRQQVACNVAGRDAASFLADLKTRLARDVKFPPGVYPVYAGSAEAQRGARRELLVHALLAGAGIVLLLATVFRRGRNLLLVLANAPFALVGGVLAVFAGGGLLSVGSLVGFVTLFGISTRNSIMMISHFEHLVRAEGCAWNLATAHRGAGERLVPILMTALVTALGLLPLAIGTGDPGREIEGPMAIVILGGLLSSTALNLLVLPTLALRYGRFTAAPNS